LVDQRDRGAGLARAHGHDEQRLTLMIFLERLANAADGARLIKIAGDLRIRLHVGERPPCVAALMQQHQLVFFQKALPGARRVAGVVPKPMLVAIGLENHRATAIGRLQAIGMSSMRPRLLPRVLNLCRHEWLGESRSSVRPRARTHRPTNRAARTLAIS